MEVTNYTCNIATLKKAVADLAKGEMKYERFIIAPDEIPAGVKLTGYKVIKEDWQKPRKRKNAKKPTVTIPKGAIRRKLFIVGVTFDTYELPAGGVCIFTPDLTGRKIDNWFEAYRGIVWAYAMESEATPLSLSGKAGKSYFDKNSFNGDSAWT